eukprot:897335-Pelagomonas_calceolata.AAC.6
MTYVLYGTYYCGVKNGHPNVPEIWPDQGQVKLLGGCLGSPFAPLPALHLQPHPLLLQKDMPKLLPLLQLLLPAVSHASTAPVPPCLELDGERPHL